MSSKSELRPAGYARLRDKYALRCLPHHVESYVSFGSRQTLKKGAIILETYPKAYWPGESDFHHLEFALKREGVHLQLLRELLPKLPQKELTDFIKSKPTGANVRRLWWIYEQSTGTEIESIPDLQQGNYVDLLNTKHYYTGKAVRSPRHRININLPGTFEFSPFIRRTEKLKQFQEKNLAETCQDFLKELSPEIFNRALQYLYTKETKSSYAIERETPDQKRTLAFVNALKNADQNDYLDKRNLVKLQQMIVDPRYANDGWRDEVGEQVYVGRSVNYTEEEIHFVAPRPQDIDDLMAAFLSASKRMLQSEMDPVVSATMIAFAFVFLHPFTDGNGRIHRFLIHYVLLLKGFTPKGMIFPVSATMTHRLADYDASLESFSIALLPLIDYEMDINGRMTVQNDTQKLYRYIDLTVAAEVLYDFVDETIVKELPSEVQFIRQYDLARLSMQKIVDLPNRHADLFVRLCLQNQGKLSKSKRHLPEFHPLTDKDVLQLEASVKMAFNME